ncbi:SGNH/GDSL hydrolase family protein [Glaciihabitans arcticus]|uniref:SGNH/GDSL hydrolase family protein n=1 Tax=Glaciihabitans arcticus TaxID=2668039 RepID=A0A4Q9GQA1_9MICO|nr:SGNH/GDSL hydrolase family protein [Glaciihabitans arcticus]TBN55425.1 SGNH/GDSL hydrolase family protein [Glaciihabitans arcticus]
MKRTLAAATILIVAGLAGCATPDATGVTGTGDKVAFYGDSYTLGTGASAADLRWSTIVSKARNWQEFNPSVNGLGFVTNRGSVDDLPDQVIANDPDIVFVTMGLNDNFSYPEEANAIYDAINADFDKLTAALPDARFIVVEPFWYTDDRPESVEVIIGWVRDAAERTGSDYIAGASHWIEGHQEWMAADGLHPNNDGYAEMAKRMDSELTKLGLPAGG